MSFGEGDLHVENGRLKEKVAELEADVDRVKGVNGELCEEINRQERVIEDRDELIRDMHRVMWACREVDCPHRENGCFRVKGNGDGECWFERRMRELRIEVH